MEKVTTYCDGCGLKIQHEYASVCLEFGYSLGGWGNRRDHIPKTNLNKLCKNCYKEYLIVIKPVINFANKCKSATIRDTWFYNESHNMYRNAILFEGGKYVITNFKCTGFFGYISKSKIEEPITIEKLYKIKNEIIKKQIELEFDKLERYN